MADIRAKYILAIDTASTQVAVALGLATADIFAVQALAATDIHLLASRDTPAARQANTTLLPTIDALLNDQGVAKEQLDAIVCGLGPGSFTGVRIALATAKGLASGLKIPLYGVPTLDAVAWQAWASGLSGYVAVVADAMRSEIYPARYLINDTLVSRLDHLTVEKVDTTLKRWNDQKVPLTLIGDGLYKYADVFHVEKPSSQQTEHNTLFSIADERYWLPTGHGLLLAFAASWQDLRRLGEAGSLLPIYTRLSDAEENERARLAEGGQIAQGVFVEVPASGVNEALGKLTSEATDNALLTETAFSPIRYRPMARQDIPWVAALEAQCFNDSPGSGECWDEAAFRAELYAKDRSWWVAWQDDDLVGFTGGMLIDGDMHILDLAVDPNRRRQGIASTLLNRLLEDARSLGATTASLEVRASNNAAIALYNSFGFDTDGTRPGYYSPPNPGEAREDAYILRYRFAEEKTNVTANNRASKAVFSSESPPMTIPPAAVLPKPVILAIETSCDETAAAVITGNGEVLANIVASQVDYHARFGGVVPEIASRKHTEAIVGVIDAAMEMAELPDWSSLDAIAVTHTPGLIGALVVGVAFAKGLAWATNLPLIAVNHMEGHIYANRLATVNIKAGQAVKPATEAVSALPADGINTEGGSVSFDTEAMTPPKVNSLFTMQSDPEPPFVVALLSGGHTMLVHVKDWANYEVLGQTLDDAVGEAFDKVAKALGLGYPGGPVISKLALEGDPKAIAFPRALMHSKDLSFSLSGLKTAVISWIREQTEAGNEISLPDVAASFQQAVIDVQVAKAAEACRQTNVSTFCLGGGVAANQALREAYVNDLQKAGIKVYFPPLALCSDNAAMIAATALDRYARQVFMPLDGDATAQSDLSFDY